ncbi:hypothetical protein GCM10018953_02590 [Streptosporangium nondiastaticum]
MHRDEARHFVEPHSGLRLILGAPILKIMELTTPRLLLRDFRASDHAAVHAFAGDPEVTRYTDWPGMHASREKHQVAD